MTGLFLEFPYAPERGERGGEWFCLCFKEREGLVEEQRVNVREVTRKRQKSGYREVEC